MLGSTLHASALLLLSWTVFVDASVLDCSKLIEHDGRSYDLSSLAGDHTMKRTRNTPPSTVDDVLRFDICTDLSQDEKIPEQDRCLKGTRACLTSTNRKSGHPDLVLQVIPLAKSDSDPPVISSDASGTDGIVLFFSGPSYPSDGDDALPQHLNVTIHCAKTASDPTWSSYDGTTAVIDWVSPSGCARKDGDKTEPSTPPKDDKGDDSEPGGKQKMGSGIGWFFLVMLLGVGAYFGIGMYYNYSTYGATGYDLIPHRDFWREVPYMLRDVAAHLCSGVRSRPTSRGGYVAV